MEFAYVLYNCLFSSVLILKGTYGQDVTQKEIEDASGQNFDLNPYLKPIKLKTTLPPRPETYGPLFNFIVNVCDVILEDFSDSRIPKYIKIIAKSLKGFGSGFLMKMMIRRFAKGLYILSAYSGKIIKKKVRNFLKIISEDKPKRKELFKALNSLYTLRQDIKMDVYIYRLKKYGRKQKRRISNLTRNIFDLIFYTISKLDDDIKDNILLKFNVAITEYIKETER